MPDYIEQPGKGLATRERVKPKPPRRYKVLLHNDDYTAMDFVVMILQDIFRKPSNEAERIMWNVHRHGVGVAGVYTKTIAEEKVKAVHDSAREHGYPLRCSTEPE